MAERQSLYEQVGGADAVDAMVDDFYDRVLSDPQLKPFFEHVALKRLLAMQKEFFTVALDGPLVYGGRPLNEAHHGHKIERKHYARFVNHLLETLNERGIAEKESSAIIGRLNTYIYEITGEVGDAG
jgi:hemoglobin